MTFQITLTEQDYLNYFLFTAWRTQAAKNSRLPRPYLYGIIMLVVATGAYFAGDEIFSAIMFVLGVAWLCFCGLFIKNQRKRIYARYVKKNYARLAGILSTIEITDDDIYTTSVFGEMRIPHKAIDEIAETAGYLFIRSVNNVLFIIPKSQADNDTAGYLGRICAWHNVKLSRYNGWK